MNAGRKQNLNGPHRPLQKYRRSILPSLGLLVLILFACHEVQRHGPPISTREISSIKPDAPNSPGQKLTGAPDIRVAVVKDGSTVVMQINLEEYLTGVLAGEVPFERWHAEALKAQAITSRSFAMFQIRKNVAEKYDVESTVMSQVFRPGFQSNPILVAAVNATHGLVLTVDGGKLFPAYFHSTCGQQTEPGESVFSEQPRIKPLSGVPCAYCTQSPGYRWKCQLNKESLTQKLKNFYGSRQSIGLLLDLEFKDISGLSLGASPGQFKRATQVLIRHANGVLQMQGNQFRLMAGPKELKSLLIDGVTIKGDVIEISGGGFGHGVGLCQYGSQGMAQVGQPYINILGMYFPGADLTRMY